MKGVNIYGSTSYQVHEDRAGYYDQRVFSVYACDIRGFWGIWDIDHQAAP